MAENVADSSKALALRGITFNAFGITFDGKVADCHRVHVPWRRIREMMEAHGTDPATVEERLARDAG